MRRLNMLVFFALTLLVPRATAVTLNPGDILISNHTGTNVQRLDPVTGAVTTLASLPGGDTPIGLAFDPSGNLYVNGGSGNIYKYIPATNSLSTFFTGSAVREGMTFDPTTGNLFSIVFGSDLIQEIMLNGTLVRTISIPGSSEVLGISARSGNLVVTDFGNGNVYLGTTAGSSFTTIGNVDAGNTYAPDIDASGNIYVNDFAGGQIVKFTPGGGGTYTKSVFISGLSEPANGLAIGDDGSFTLSEFGGDDVAIFNSDGSLRRRFPGVISPDELTVFAPIRTGGVPEPSTTVLLVSGIVGLGILARRRVVR